VAGRNERNWDALSASQKRRYESAGRSGRLTGEPFLQPSEVRAYYDSGANLGAARGHATYDRIGHTLVRPAWAAPKEPTDRAKVNLNTDDDRRRLAKWRRSRAFPKWMPRDTSTFRTDVAAILSEIDVGPRRWRSVTVEKTPTGRYQLTILITGRATSFVTTLPDSESLSELGRLLNDYSRLQLASPKERRQLEREWKSNGDKKLHIAVDIAGRYEKTSSRADIITKLPRERAAPLSKKPPAQKVRAQESKTVATPLERPSRAATISQESTAQRRARAARAKRTTGDAITRARRAKPTRRKRK
jgi:hypothetical protein